jgi:large subunit ribosomal protein L3
MQALLGQKREQSQRFLDDGTRVPVTVVSVPANPVVAIRTEDKNGYSAVQLGFGSSKKPHKSLLGISKKANLASTPSIYREVKLADDAMPAIGDLIKVSDVFKPGDIVSVTGISKGKGWAGGVKRYGFRGGPRTHGQSDRERAPGSIGQTTTPGRVYKGKRMAGRMGHEQVTVKNLKVVDVADDTMLIAGLVPGPLNNVLLIQKIGEDKKFVPLFSLPVEEPAQEEVKEEAPVEIKEEDQAIAAETEVEESAQETVKSEESGEVKEESSDAK